MDVLDLARWQFGITTVYHFIFVPLSMGLSAIVAGLHAAWIRTGADRYQRLTRFYGKLLIVNFVLGVVTGLVQEFQFGMNWSAFSRFVGDIFGTPLALEALLAFFLEATFLGLWVFGWDRLPRRVHLACIWIVAVGTQLSAYVILSANAWMQHPVGYRIDPATGRAQLTDFIAVLTNDTAVVAYAHVLAASFVTSGALVAGVAFWHLARGNETHVFRTAAKAACVIVLVAGAAVVATGDQQQRVIGHDQPMKTSAAEAVYETSGPASFSLIKIGSFDLRVPYLLSVLETGTLDGQVEGVNDIQREYVRTYGPGNYLPNVPATYWNFRAMIGFGLLAVGAAFGGLWLLRRERRKGVLPGSKWLARAALVLPLLPLLANSAGWIFTENGRQPWLAFGLFRTADGVSPGSTVTTVAISLAAFTVLYAALAVLEVGLLARIARNGTAGEQPAFRDEPAPDPDAPLTLAY